MSIKIAFISYEYPPDTQGGGIGTYTKNITRVLVKNGFDVTVFCATPKVGYNYVENCIKIYRVNSTCVEEFRFNVLSLFKEIHQKSPFDIVESSDYGADGYYVKKEFIDICYVVKLHTPTFLINVYNNYGLQYIYFQNPFYRLKYFLSKFLSKDYLCDIEYKNIALADHIQSPSKALAKVIHKWWKVDLKKITILPNPHYIFTKVPIKLLSYENRRITFIGKLSILKGLINFPEIIKNVHNKYPEIQFRFIGEDSFSSIPNVTMKQYLLSQSIESKKNIEFLGKVNHSDIEKYLRDTDILVCNSLWENYPMVLIEAMSLGRVIIATNTGGIPEIILNGKNGILVSVNSPKKMAKEIISCFSNIKKMKIIGQNAYDSYKKNYSSENLDKKITNYYKNIFSAHV